MTLYEESPGYFYDDTHKKWSLFKENGQWRLEDLANNTRSDHPSFGAAVSALKSHVGDVTVHRKKAMSALKKAALKLAKENPKFKQALLAEIKIARSMVLQKDVIESFQDGMKAGQSASVASREYKNAHHRLTKAVDALKDPKKWPSPIGPGGLALGLAAAVERALTDTAYWAGGVAASKTASTKTADKWETKPKGWTDASRKKFWESLTSAAPKHKVTECIKRMNKHMGGNAGAFCASLADRVTPGWRQEAAKDKKANLTQPLSLRRDYGAGSDEEWLSIDEVRKHCPPCADKMAANNIRKVKASTLRLAMQRR